MSDSKKDSKRNTGKRGRPPSLNKRQTKKHRREVIIKASMDVYQVEHLRETVREQLRRFEDMAKGGDGGKLRPTHTESIREQHYSDWSDRDFKDVARDLKKAIKEFDENNTDGKKND